ncbi:hypothetical protein SVIOM74S_09329 [Streptomyces violarus]
MHELAARRWLPGACEHGGRAGLGVQPGQALAGHHGHDGTLGALAGRPLGAGGVHVPCAEVGDPDPVGPPGLDTGLDGGARVVDMDMDVPQPVAADHDERVAERVEPLTQPLHGRVLGLQQVDHLEGGAVHVGRCGTVGTLPARGADGRSELFGGFHARVRAPLVRVQALRVPGRPCGHTRRRTVRLTGHHARVRSPRAPSAPSRQGSGPPGLGHHRAPRPRAHPQRTRRHRRGRLPRPLPRERLHQRPEHRHQPPSAGVDHPGALQDGQLARRRGQRRARSLIGRPGHRPAVALGTAGRVGSGRGDREDRALDGVGHGLPGGVGRVPQGQPQAPAVGVRALAAGLRGAALGQHLGHAAQ